MTRRNLILVGGIFHDFQASAEALSTALEPLEHRIPHRTRSRRGGRQSGTAAR